MLNSYHFPPGSGLVSWLVMAAGALMAMHVVGVNIQPLLTVGGVSGVVVALAAQSVMANMVSGANLVRNRKYEHKSSRNNIENSNREIRISVVLTAQSVMPNMVSGANLASDMKSWKVRSRGQGQEGIGLRVAARTFFP